MILVTVGTHDQQFNRLVRAADELAGITTENVIIQRGRCDYTPLHAEYFDFVPMTKMLELVAQAHVVIAQAGAGTIIAALDQTKPLVVVPRLARFGEHYNDHQIELAQALSEQKRAVLVSEPTGAALTEAVEKSTSQALLPPTRAQPLVAALRAQFAVWEAGIRKAGR